MASFPQERATFWQAKSIGPQAVSSMKPGFCRSQLDRLNSVHCSGMARSNLDCGQTHRSSLSKSRKHKCLMLFNGAKAPSRLGNNRTSLGTILQCRDDHNAGRTASWKQMNDRSSGPQRDTCPIMPPIVELFPQQHSSHVLQTLASLCTLELFELGFLQPLQDYQDPLGQRDPTSSSQMLCLQTRIGVMPYRLSQIATPVLLSV